MGQGGRGELLFNEYGITNVQEETFLEKCFNVNIFSTTELCI